MVTHRVCDFKESPQFCGCRAAERRKPACAAVDRSNCGLKERRLDATPNIQPDEEKDTSGFSNGTRLPYRQLKFWKYILSNSCAINLTGGSRQPERQSTPRGIRTERDILKAISIIRSIL
jgi:hypothetical protein